MKDQKKLTMEERLQHLETERAHVENFDRNRELRPGQLTPRQRIAALIDEDSLVEIGAFAQSQYEDVGPQSPADGLIAGYARIGGRRAMVLAEDPLALANSDAQVAKQKHNRAVSLAIYRRLPIVYLADGSPTEYRQFAPEGGMLIHRVAEQTPARDVAERVQPFVSVVFGACSGQDAAFAVRADLVIATDGAQLSAGEPATARAESRVDVAATDDASALETAKRFLQLFPTSLDKPLEAGSHSEALRPLGDEPAASSQELLDGLIDHDSSVVLTSSSKSHRIGVGRVEGLPVVFAFTGEGAPLQEADVRNLAKVTRWSLQYRIPFVSTQNCAGYEPEQAGGAGYLDAVGATVENLRASESPKFGIITGLGHAMGDFALGGRGTGFDLIWAWPSAELGIADTRGFAGGQSEKDESRGPWQPAEWSVVDDVIKPSESRAWLARALRLTASIRAYPSMRHDRGMELTDMT